MGDDWGDAQGPDRVPPSGGATDHKDDGETLYPEVEEATESTGLHPIGVYIKRRQTTIEERMACRTFYELCTEAERMPGTSRMVRWWDQDTVNKPEE